MGLIPVGMNDPRGAYCFLHCSYGQRVIAAPVSLSLMEGERKTACTKKTDQRWRKVRPGETDEAQEDQSKSLKRIGMHRLTSEEA
jgi:hypothetical protein